MLPREKLIELGVESLTLAELFSLILGSGTPKQDVFDLSNAVTSQPDFRKLILDQRVEYWTQIPGIGSIKAARLVAGIELSKRVFFAKSDNPFIRTSKDVFLHFQNEMTGKTNESFYLLCLDTKHKVIYSNEIHVGLSNSVVTDMKVLFSAVLQTGSLSFICVHNHPSQDVQPSNEDRELTVKIRQASRVLDVQFLDHVIVSTDSYYSLFENEPDLFL